MSARDRIRAVAETLREPRSVNWISEQADAAWSTTNEELQNLVDPASTTSACVRVADGVDGDVHPLCWTLGQTSIASPHLTGAIRPSARSHPASLQQRSTESL
jgi:hypothetical protein